MYTIGHGIRGFLYIYYVLLPSTTCVYANDVHLKYMCVFAHVYVLAVVAMMILTFDRSNALCLPSESGGFTAIHVWGFEDAPVTQGRVEHSYFLHGENLLSLVLTQNQQYHLYKSLATWDFTQ